MLDKVLLLTTYIDIEGSTVICLSLNHHNHKYTHFYNHFDQDLPN